MYSIVVEQVLTFFFVYFSSSASLIINSSTSGVQFALAKFAETRECICATFKKTENASGMSAAEPAVLLVTKTRM